MKRRSKVLILIFLLTAIHPWHTVGQKLEFSGQVSGTHVSRFADPWLMVTGLRYIPMLKGSVPLNETLKFDGEASVNAFGYMNWEQGQKVGFEGDLKPYRIWARISAERFEVRLGLQKINFGSAVMLRPLMWFDKMDPRDPLQLTDGVYGALGRYYFRNNANIWVWGLLRSKTPKGWEMLGSGGMFPEAGGRLQMPAGKGEIALSGHYRMIGTDQSKGYIPITIEEPLPEMRLGLDGKWDIGPGIWFEGTYTWSKLPVEELRHTRMLTVGADYTFGLGNGLTMMGEQFIYQSGPEMLKSTKSVTFTATSLTYPINLTHSLSAMVFYNWTSGDWYRFINWRISLENISFYLIGFWNPGQFDLFLNSGNSNLMAGNGVQLMFVWNH